MANNVSVNVYTTNQYVHINVYTINQFFCPCRDANLRKNCKTKLPKTHKMQKVTDI